MLLRFLAARDTDLASASEADLQEFRRWRLDDGELTVGEAAWNRDAAAIGSLYDFMVRQGTIARRPWRSAAPGRRSLSIGVGRDLRVRHMDLDQYLFLRDVGFGGLAVGAGLSEGGGRIVTERRVSWRC